MIRPEKETLFEEGTERSSKFTLASRVHVRLNSEAVSSKGLEFKIRQGTVYPSEGGFPL